MIDKEQVLAALSKVLDPDLQKDLVSLNMIKDLTVSADNISFSVELTTPACPMKDEIKRACENAIRHMVSDTAELAIKMTAQVKQSNMDKGQLQHIKNILLVVSGKGGVGKSTIATNLAVGLAQEGAQVGLLDADIHGPSIPHMMGLQEARPGSSENKKMVPVKKHGVQVNSIGFMLRPEQALVWRGPMVSSALKQLAFDTLWGPLDYLIIDAPPGTGDIHLTLAQAIPISSVLVVSTPQQVAIADARKALAMFDMKGLEKPVLGLVENMSYLLAENGEKTHPFGQGGAAQLAKEFNSQVLAKIPLDSTVTSSGDLGSPAILSGSTALKEMVQKVAQALSIQNMQAK